MKVTCAGVFKSGQIRNLEPGKLRAMKAKHGDGEACTITFEDTAPRPEGPFERAFKLFHVVVERYAKANGYNKETAKTELKWLHGERMQYVEGFKPPDWSKGRFALIDGSYWYLKSTTIYDMTEISALIDGSLQACIECGAEVEDLLEGIR